MLLLKPPLLSNVEMEFGNSDSQAELPKSLDSFALAQVKKTVRCASSAFHMVAEHSGVPECD